MEYISIIKEIRSNLSCYKNEDIIYRNKKYCEFFSSLIKHEDIFIFNKVKFDNVDMNLTLNMLFNESDIENMIIYFYQIEQKHLFDDNYLTNVSYCPDFVLSKDDYKNIISFLFLYFNPYIAGHKNMWNHPIHDKPLMVFTNITNNNFNILLHLFNEDIFYKNCKLKFGFNLCHQLIEFYLDNISGSIFYKNKINNLKDDNFPIYKIKKLIKEGFVMNSFLEIRDHKMYFTSQSLSTIMEEIIIECNMEKLEEGVNILTDEYSKIVKV